MASNRNYKHTHNVSETLKIKGFISPDGKSISYEDGEFDKIVSIEDCLNNSQIVL